MELLRAQRTSSAQGIARGHGKHCETAAGVASDSKNVKPNLQAGWTTGCAHSWRRAARCTLRHRGHRLYGHVAARKFSRANQRAMEAVRVAILLAFSSTQRHVIGLQLADGIMRCGVLVDRKEDAAPLKLQKAGVGVSAIDWRCGLHADASSPFKSVKHFFTLVDRLRLQLPASLRLSRALLLVLTRLQRCQENGGLLPTGTL